MYSHTANIDCDHARINTYRSTILKPYFISRKYAMSSEILLRVQFVINVPCALSHSPKANDRKPMVHIQIPNIDMTETAPAKIS